MPALQTYHVDLSALALALLDILDKPSLNVWRDNQIFFAHNVAHGDVFVRGLRGGGGEGDGGVVRELADEGVCVFEGDVVEDGGRHLDRVDVQVPFLLGVMLVSERLWEGIGEGTTHSGWGNGALGQGHGFDVCLADFGCDR